MPVDKTTFERVAAMRDVPFDESCIVVCDRSLPPDLLKDLPDPIAVDAGESLKTLASIETLAGLVLKRRATRPMTLVAVGGGTIGDAVGFLASILWRGVDLWHVPTTLLAMADSSHGGKTALNLGPYKNQIGTFYQASHTFIVEQALATLTPRLRADGMAELVKVLMIDAPDRLAEIMRPGCMNDLLAAPFEDVRDSLCSFLDEAIRIKHAIVESDPYEQDGRRTLLNLGHTIAHALELLQGLTHGQAVAWGLVACLDLSTRFGLAKESRDELRRLLYPLLQPLRGMVPENALLQAIARDKKHADGRLRSIVLESPGRAMVTRDLSALDWKEALEGSRAWFESVALRVAMRAPRTARIEPQAGKSELNRALVIAALRTGRTTILGRSDADDVRNTVAALKALGCAVTDARDGYRVTPVEPGERDAALHERIDLHCGAGGTTFRFLLPLAAMRPGRTRMFVDPQLMRRPHHGLLDALRRAGAHLERFETDGEQGYDVRGWDAMPRSFEIDVTVSSQYASALAMLALVADGPFTLTLKGDMVSAGYLAMTLAMLEQAGVECIHSRNMIAFNPTPRLDGPVEFRIPPDAGALAVWRVAARLGVPVDLPGVKADTTHPDASIDALLDAIDGPGAGELVLDLSGAPDLVPVLAVYALRAARPVRFTGIAHARFKESDRLGALAESFRGAGVVVAVESDTLVIPAHASAAFSGERVFATHGDHRLAFAGTLLALLTGPLVITDPWCVTKSAPDFWQNVRALGWETRVNSAG